MIKYFNITPRSIFIILIMCIVFAACSTGKEQEKSITVSVLPQKYFVEQIVGGAFSVNVMLPPGVSPEGYEPLAKQVQKLSNSSVYFYIGHLGFEKAWMKKFSATTKNVDYVSCSKKIDLLRGDPTNNNGDGDYLYGTDPHIWTSPENVKTISHTICTTLSEKFPEKADEFERNLKKFVEKIDTLDNFIRLSLADSTHRSFMIFHPSLSYYARDYNLEQIPIEFEGKSLSPAYMKRMVDLAMEKNITTVFVQKQFDISKAKVVANEIGANVVQVDPLSEDWLNEMYSITVKMGNALGK